MASCWTVKWWRSMLSGALPTMPTAPEVTLETVFDLASITKVMATTADGHAAL